MKHKTLLFSIIALLFSLYSYAQNDITMVVSGSGETKEGAVASALRSGIEQAYGSFVSSNTSILNDELVKDEIVSVASGVVKSYKEVTIERLKNGIYYVTLNAIFSLNQMTVYAKSKGSSAELSGNTFAMNMKLKEINKRNESMVLENLLIQVKEMIPYVFERSIKLGELSYVDENSLCLPLQVGIKYSNSGKQMLSLLYNTLKNLAISRQEIYEYRQLNIPYFEVVLYEIPHVKGLIAYEDKTEISVDRYYSGFISGLPYLRFFLRNAGSLDKISIITKLLAAESRNFNIISNQDDMIKCFPKEEERIEKYSGLSALSKKYLLDLEYALNSPNDVIHSAKVSIPRSVCFGALYGNYCTGGSSDEVKDKEHPCLKCYIFPWKEDQNRFDEYRETNRFDYDEYRLPTIELHIKSDNISKYSSFNIERVTD